MERFRLGIDIDDTTCYLINVIDEIIKNKYNVKKITDKYNLVDRYILDEGKLTEKEVSKIIYDKVDWLELEPVKDAIECIKELQENGAELHFITHRIPEYTPDTLRTSRKWLSKYFNEFNLIMCKDKVKMCEMLNIKYMIDNDIKVFNKRNDKVKVFLYTGALENITTPDEFKYKYNSWIDIKNEILLSRS